MKSLTDQPEPSPQRLEVVVDIMNTRHIAFQTRRRVLQRSTPPVDHVNITANVGAQHPFEFLAALCIKWEIYESFNSGSIGWRSILQHRLVVYAALLINNAVDGKNLHYPNLLEYGAHAATEVEKLVALHIQESYPKIANVIQNDLRLSIKQS